MYSKNVRKTSKEESKKGPASLLKISLWGSSVSTCANEQPGFCISVATTPNGLFQTINGLKKFSQLLQTAPLTILNFSLTFKVKLFLIFHVCEKFTVYHDMKGLFTTREQIFQFFLFVNFSSYENA